MINVYGIIRELVINDNMIQIMYSTQKICLAISFSIIFIIKLIKAHNRYDGHDSSLFLSTINKITILSLISLLITIMAITISFIRIIRLMHGIRSNGLDLVSFTANLLDNYTNFLSVMLSFTFFERLYMILLGRVDKFFRYCCWGKLLSIQTEKNLAEITIAGLDNIVRSNSSPSSPSNSPVSDVVDKHKEELETDLQINETGS